MKQYIKEINGKNIKKYAKEIIIEKDGKITINPTEEMILADGWEIYISPEPSPAMLLRKAKNAKLDLIMDYDSSENVNIFYINDMPIWLDKNTRAGLKLRFEAELAINQESTSLWYDDMCFTLQLNTAMQMLYALEVYASKCYDNTKMHIANVNKLEDINEIEMYNYKLGYPDILHFSN